MAETAGSRQSDKHRVVSAHLQDCIVRLAIESDDFLRLVRPVLGPSVLTSRIPAELYRLCLNYWDTFRRQPGDHFHDEVVRFLKQVPEGQRNYYVNYVQKIQQMHRPDMPYVLGRVNDFVRAREFEKAAVRFAELTAEGKFSEAENLMHRTLRTGVGKYEMGLEYLDTGKPPLRDDPERWNRLMRTGIKPLDKAIGGFKRGQFICWMGGFKGKKSWACIHTALTALLQGLTVVHVSHEMTLEEIETRYDMMISGMTNRDEPTDLTINTFDEQDGCWVQKQMRADTIKHNWARVASARRRVRRFGGKLYVKKYPMGTADMHEVDRYLRHLAMEGIRADVLINDYADIMAPLDPRKELRHQLSDTYIYHKRLADERQILVVTATQVPDKAVRSARMTIRDFAEDRRKAGHVDLAIAICQTEDQEAENIATLLVVANRSGPQGMRCMISAIPAIGQFCLGGGHVLRAKPKPKEVGKGG